MPVADPNKIWPQLEQDGAEEVRKKLAIGVYARYKIPVIEEWLRRQAASEDALNRPHEQSIPVEPGEPEQAETHGIHRDGIFQPFIKSVKRVPMRILRACKTLFLRIWHDPVWSKVIALGIVALVGVSWAWLNTAGIQNTQKASRDSVDKHPPKTEEAKLNIVLEGVFPYLQNVPILDKTIYIKWNFAHLSIGGKNIARLSIAARTRDGRNAGASFDAMRQEIDYSMYDWPYVEFEYSGKLYSIEVLGEVDQFSYILRKVPDIAYLTMYLEKVPDK